MKIPIFGCEMEGYRNEFCRQARAILTTRNQKPNKLANTTSLKVRLNLPVSWDTVEYNLMKVGMALARIFLNLPNRRSQHV